MIFTPAATTVLTLSALLAAAQVKSETPRDRLSIDYVTTAAVGANVSVGISTAPETSTSTGFYYAVSVFAQDPSGATVASANGSETHCLGPTLGQTWRQSFVLSAQGDYAVDVEVNYGTLDNTTSAGLVCGIAPASAQHVSAQVRIAAGAAGGAASSATQTWDLAPAATAGASSGAAALGVHGRGALGVLGAGVLAAVAMAMV